MDAKDTIIEDWILTDIAETLYNLPMNIQGIKSTLWQLAIQQARLSFEAGQKDKP